MKIVDVNEKISLEDLRKFSEKMFNKIVKAVVDVEKEIMVVDADMHADQEALLLEQGSDQGKLWGINFHPAEYPDESWVEFDAMINIQPSWGNSSRGVDDPKNQQRIKEIVKKLVVQ